MRDGYDGLPRYGGQQPGYRGPQPGYGTQPAAYVGRPAGYGGQQGADASRPPRVCNLIGYLRKLSLSLRLRLPQEVRDLVA